MEKKGKIEDLVEKLKRGELPPKEVLKKLEERKLTEGTWGRWEWQALVFTFWIVYFVLWLLPPVSRQLKLVLLEPLAQLPAISFPAIVIYILLAIGFLGILLCIWATRMHYKKGGLNHDETVILLKEGPYRVMRHPAALGGMMLLILLPIILSPYVPFTILSIGAVITMIVYLYHGCYLEEKLDIEKWGDEYRQYMKEVPRFNFIKGLWNLKKKQGIYSE